MSPRSLALAALGAALTAICAQLSLTLPLLTSVPFTLQVFAVLLMGAVLGARTGALAELLYLLLGAAGVPVFAHFRAGLQVLVGPTGGYLWSYPLAAFLVGWAADQARDRRSFVRNAAVGMVAGIACIYALGVMGLVLSGAAPTVGHAVRIGVVPFVWFDLLKAALALLVADRIRAVVPGRELAR
ncbi:MAG: biotin transporter BioY [Armatimonadota bacterium]|nr:biotin transporter BioY [Armatimonadota bacterium]MDR7444137.1 biotin transporter BioY [Armatimonadota bacterium]MDR7569554.1 biotin transporter BioY [Armatimonadota bacterium]MDR7613586.1 biotin transporter BioY [Armatimonadota bacterium]